MRICIISANLPPLYTGGGQQAVTLGAAFRDLGHEVLFVTKRHGGLPQQDRLAGMDVERVEYDTRAYAGAVRTAKQVWRFGRRLLALRHRYDVVLFFNPEGGFHHSWVVIPVLHLLGKRTVTRMTLLDANDPAALTRKRFAWFRLMPYRLHDRVVAISTALAQSFESVFGRDARLVYIPNGVDTGRFHPLPPDERRRVRRELGLRDDLKYCTFVGRISYRKGIDLLIDAWAEVAAARPDARLLLVGPEYDEFREDTQDDFARALRETIRRHGLEPSIMWTGRTETPERYLQASDVFVFTSRREGCPNALLEAMACGVPIVSTLIPDITEDLVTPDVHALVVRQDAAAFATALVTMLSQRIAAPCLAQQALSRVRSEFAIEVTARRYLETLESL